MRRKPANRISRKALSVWRIKGMIETSLLLFILVIAYFFMNDHPLANMVMWGAVTVVLLYGVARVIIWPQLRWKSWRYEVFEKEIELLRGIFIVKHTLIPMTRVQHVDTEQGPIYKRYQLTAVTISTAAGVHEIPALTEELGSSLRDQIAELAGMDENNHE